MKLGPRAGALLFVSGALLLGGCAASVADTTPAATPAVTVSLSATGVAFEQTELTVAADAAFAIRFEIRDNVPHNVAILGPQKMASEVFSGPAARTYTFGALPPGSYTFLCEVHPEMTGTVVSQ